MSISNVGAVTALWPAAATLGAGLPPEAAPAALAPAVRLDIRSADTAQAAAFDRSDTAKTKASLEDVERQNRIDPETKTVVYQEIDPTSGDIVVQIPDAVILKARAYAEAQTARDHKVDRTA